MQICLKCYSLQTHNEDKNIICKECGHIQSLSSYLSALRQAKNAVRNGYLYRVRYENDKKRKISNKAYSLIDLNKAFDFFATAVISGVMGNFAYDQIKQLFGKLRKSKIIIEIDDARLQSFLKSERQQEKFIKYIQEYRENKLKAPRKNIKPKPKSTKTPKKSKSR